MIDAAQWDTPAQDRLRLTVEGQVTLAPEGSWLWRKALQQADAGDLTIADYDAAVSDPLGGA